MATTSSRGRQGGCRDPRSGARCVSRASPCGYSQRRRSERRGSPQCGRHAAAMPRSCRRRRRPRGRRAARGRRDPRPAACRTPAPTGCGDGPSQADSSPIRTSKTVIEVVQTDSDGCSSNHASTVWSGSRCINAESTFVSSKIKARADPGARYSARRSLTPVGPDVPAARAVREALSRVPRPQSALRSASPARRGHAHRSVRRSARSRVPPARCCDHADVRGAAELPSRHRRAV